VLRKYRRNRRQKWIAGFATTASREQSGRRVVIDP
jgi:hypothetical protein